MRVRGFILLTAFVMLLVEQLPLDPRLWDAGEHACCALAEACPMSARPASGRAAAMPDCDMAEHAPKEPECTMRGLCGSPAGGSEAAFWNSALARPALIAASGWAQTMVELGAPPPAAELKEPVSASRPPTPPPRRLS